MRKSHFLFAILLMFLFVGQTIAQNIEGAARMDAMTAENLSAEKANTEKASVSNSVSNVKPLEKTAPIEISNAPLTTHKVVKGERIKKNLKPEKVEKTDALGTLTLVGIILAAIGLIFVATIILWPVGVIFLVIGLVLLIIGLVMNK